MNSLQPYIGSISRLPNLATSGLFRPDPSVCDLFSVRCLSECEIKSRDRIAIIDGSVHIASIDCFTNRIPYVRDVKLLSWSLLPRYKIVSGHH
jgi:hypothetical protein